MHFNCDFHPCALTKEAAQREARIPPPPLSAASGAAPTSLCIDLPKVSLFQLPVRPNRPEINVPPVASSDARIRSPPLSSSSPSSSSVFCSSVAPAHRISYVRARFIFPPSVVN